VSVEHQGGLERALTLAAPYLAALALAYATLSGILWLAGEVAGWLWTHRWAPASGGTALTVLAAVLRDPAHPALSWPAAARHDLAPPLLFYALAVVLIAAVVVPAARLALSYLARSRRWADPNPGRAGFATSAALTTLTSASALDDRIGPSYDLWLGLERGPAGGLRALRGHGDRQTAGVVGPPGSGKTLGLILPGLLCWAGSAVATSTKTDVVLLAGAAREALGRQRSGGVHLLDWSGLVGPDLGLAAVCWDPLDGCCDTRVASSRVAALLGAVDGHRGRDTNDGFWKEGAGVVLRPYLHAAALVGADIGQVLLWLDQRESNEPARIIESHNPRAAVWADRLRGLAGSPSPVTIGGYFETAKSCFGALQDPAVLEACSRSSLDVEAFLDSASTLFVVDPAGEAETSPTAPLTVALVDWICDRAYARARRQGICEPRLGLFLDEVANIAPLASLGRHLAQGASQGVHVAYWSAQAFAQLEERYGERSASTIWSLTRYALVFGGSREVEWLERISALAGEFAEPERTVTTTTGRDERSVAERLSRRRVLSVESLARLPRGEAVLLTEGEVLRVLVPPLHPQSSGALRPLARMLGRPSAAAPVLQSASGSSVDRFSSKSARPALPIAGGPGGEAA
jgi:type IV secretion system protein VirD4